LKTNGSAKNADGKRTEWVCFVTSKLKEALRKKEIAVSPTFTDELMAIYKAGFKKSAPHLFLSGDSSLFHIPSGDKWRHSSECYYGRAAMIERSCLSATTLSVLDKGKI
jgi:hypothetical protein